MIRELPHQIVTLVHSGPAKENVRLRLYKPLSLYHALSLVAWDLSLHVPRVCGRRFFLHLEKQRIRRTITEAQDDVVTRANAARPYDFERDIDRRQVAFDGHRDLAQSLDNLGVLLRESGRLKSSCTWFVYAQWSSARDVNSVPLSQ